MKNFKELTVWKKGIELVKVTYQLSKKFPAEEKFGMISQMTRAAISIPANIAEGSSGDREKDYARFLQIALGSAFELQTYFVIGREMHWIQIDDLTKPDEFLVEEIKMLYGLIKRLKGPNS